MKEVSPWRVILTAVAFIYGIVQIVMLFSDVARVTSDSPPPMDTRQIMELTRDYQQKAIEDLQQGSNDILYQNAGTLDSMNDYRRKIYGLRKMTQDSLVTFDLGTRLKIPKDAWFQNNHDDSLRMAIRTKENLLIFFHDFAGGNDDEKNIRSLKRKLQLSNWKNEKTVNGKAFSYTLKHGDMPYSGFAFSLGEPGQPVYYEIESATLTKRQLQGEAYRFLLNNIVSASKKPLQ